MMQDKLPIPFVGVIPYLHLDIDDEDSLSERLQAKQTPAVLDIAVIRLPRISNFTDFAPLERMPGVSVRYITRTTQLKQPDLILLPGSKNTMEDLKWMRQNGLEAAVKKYAASGMPVFGICGGYQMMGLDACRPRTCRGGRHDGRHGLLPVHTTFCQENHHTQVRRNRTSHWNFCRIDRRAYGMAMRFTWVIRPMSRMRIISLRFSAMADQ